MFKRKSICGRYTCYWIDHHANAFVKNNITGVIYDGGLKETNGKYYAPSHGMTGYSAYGSGMKRPHKYFTLRFADFHKGRQVRPFSGNAIINHYEAVFITPKSQ